jgi:hypothetical protein
MGVLYDYFRASDAVANDPDWFGPLVPYALAEQFDAVDAKGIEPTVILGRLVGILQGVPWSLDLVGTTPVAPQAADEEDDDSESGVLRLADGARDTLASVTAEQAPAIAARWAEIGEFFGRADTVYLAETLTDLAALSRRAKAAGEHLFCWWSL